MSVRKVKEDGKDASVGYGLDGHYKEDVETRTPEEDKKRYEEAEKFQRSKSRVAEKKDSHVQAEVKKIHDDIHHDAEDEAKKVRIEAAKNVEKIHSEAHDEAEAEAKRLRANEAEAKKVRDEAETKRLHDEAEVKRVRDEVEARKAQLKQKNIDK